jgi:hypothetical protein
MNRDEMARRKNDGLVDVFMELPWSASVIAGFMQKYIRNTAGFIVWASRIL